MAVVGFCPPPIATAFRNGTPKPRQKASSSPPWNCSRVGRTRRTTSRTSSTVLSMNSATTSTSGASALRIIRASCTCTWRGPPPANTKPTASTPSSLARRTSPARVMPQNLIRVRNSVLRIWMGITPSRLPVVAVGQADRSRQAPPVRIQRTDEHQPVRRCGGPRQRPVAAGEQFRRPAFRGLAASYRQQATHDVADHVVKKGVGLDLDLDHLALTAHGTRMHGAARMRGLAVHGAEGGEVVLAHQRLRGAMHGPGIQRQPFPGQRLALQRRTYRAVEDAIAVAARAGGKACVEVVGDRPAPE